ncbi:sulfur carrier protein ThiS [Vibrio sp. YMD68]|uniref:sulfur carrier protein ThiS n=1 Tax=Vibrio sp. YMD68 TaxID=3042300 RepID=UPI00249C5D91|nr:sulfur carrier protein ThiS [Vibrio sp. YMD68]WGW00321.1 sulfur carrier protein ThiS [Vibrio sp. YMD68]
MSKLDAESKVDIEINGKVTQIQQGSTLQDVIRILALPDNGCVFSINNTIVSRNRWESTLLKNNDSISLFQAIAGG